MSATFSGLQSQTDLPCLSDCGLCCHNPEVEATPLEMVPMALKILDEGTLEEWYERLQASEGKPCLIFNGKNCGSYNERPSLCRMFGVAGYYNKQHEVTLSICKLIKEERPEATAKALKEAGPHTPVMTQWTSQMQALNPILTESRRPINQALKIALEKVALWSQYQE